MAEYNIDEIIQEENLVYKKSKVRKEDIMHYCPGCGHSTANNIIADVIDEIGIQSEIIGVGSVGCSVFIYNYIDIDFHQAAHGRASAVATGIKRLLPDKYVFTYQGDGDLAAIGTAETIHTCNRGENITIIFVNNGIYGMTGGQMAPTTLKNMVTTTCPFGRDEKTMGNPIKITELVADLPGTYYVTRQAVNTPSNVRKTKKAIKFAFESQKKKKGVSFVEIVSSCNSNWRMNPIEANKWMEENMFPFYPLGDIKVPKE
ncbi:thiamine pyrophosphate-dependent enzyme [Bacteroidota bacterium]